MKNLEEFLKWIAEFIATYPLSVPTFIIAALLSAWGVPAMFIPLFIGAVVAGIYDARHDTNFIQQVLIGGAIPFLNGVAAAIVLAL